jgi:hypothetical protein
MGDMRAPTCANPRVILYDQRGSGLSAAPSSPVPCATLSSEMTYSDGQVRHLLERGYELAASQLEGINEAALELADAAGGNRRVMDVRFASSPNECASTRAMPTSRWPR